MWYFVCLSCGILCLVLGEQRRGYLDVPLHGVWDLGTGPKT
jgi:hypothetical protein